MKRSTLALLLRCSLTVPLRLRAQAPQAAPPVPLPDERYKADILLIVAHPDDDTGVSNYLSKAALDEGKRVAVIFSTKGNSGGNAVGMEQSKALSDVREMEARRSLEARGVSNIWFLRGVDTPTQDVLHSLETVGHGEALEEVVRLVRLTRPEVVLTWMPFYVAGENHGDHQASGVLATEAFDLAADPTVFPEQVNSPRMHGNISNYGEGLQPWQPKKLYYFSDASHPEFLEHLGPKYLASDMSTSRKMSFADLNRLAWKLYGTQLDFGDEMLKYYVNMPDYLVRAKSYVTSPVEADVWDGISREPLPYHRPSGYSPSSDPGVSMELGGPWSFYQQFYRAHDLKGLVNLTAPQTALSADHRLWVPLLLHNATDQPHRVLLHTDLPQGWSSPTKDLVYDLTPHSTFPVDLFLTAPAFDAKTPPVQLTWTLSENGQKKAETSLKTYMEYNGVPQ